MMLQVVIRRVMVLVIVLVSLPSFTTGAGEGFLKEEVRVKAPETKISTVSVKGSKPYTVDVTPQGKILLAKLVTAEAKGESYEGKVAVAEVVLNRVDDKRFPDTVKEVIYQDNQFSPVMDGSINNQPTEASIKAVEEALVNKRDKRIVFFYNPSIVGESWLDARTVAKRIGNHVFTY